MSSRRENRNRPPHQRERKTHMSEYSHPAQTFGHHSEDTYKHSNLGDWSADSPGIQYYRQPSAHLSEIESTDESYMASQQQDMREEVDPDSSLIDRAPSVSRGSYSSVSMGGRRDDHHRGRAFQTTVEAKHPSDSRLRQARTVSQANSSFERGAIGTNLGPKNFKATRNQNVPSISDHDRYPEDVNNTQDYNPDVSPRNHHIAAPIGPLRGRYQPRPSKMAQVTKFDTPSDKGSTHGQSRLSSSTSRSGRTGVSQTPAQKSRDRRDSGILGQTDENSTGKLSRLGNGRITSNRITENEDKVADEDNDDHWLGEVMAITKGVEPTALTPPSDKTLSMSRLAKIGLTTSDGFDVGDFDDLMDGIDDMILVPGALMNLKMPKTVNQVVKHISTVLKKVAKDQGESALKSCDTWNWSRLPVLSSEMNACMQEMEEMIHTAGESRQGGIEETKRKRVEHESGLTDKYEEFRADFREACVLMQQPAKLGKKFKFGPF